MGKLIYSLVAAGVTTSAAAGLSAGVLALPKGPAREAAERFVVAPGEAAMERLDTKRFRKLRKKAEKTLDKGKEKLEDASERLGEKAADVGAERLAEELENLPHYWNVGVWAGAGFALCFLGTLLFGISSLKSALALGFKVTLFMIFLQGALIFGGLIAYQKLTGL